MTQPEWELVANLGEADLEEGAAYLVFRDTTSVYPPEAEYVSALVDERGEPNGRYAIYRIVLEPHTFVGGVLSDNPSHPDYPAWYAARDPEHRRRHGYDQWTRFCQIADSNDMEPEGLAGWFCSDDPVYRAMAYREMADFHGWFEFDDQPLELTRDEVVERYRRHGLEV